MSRPLGSRIYQLCQVLQDFGPLSRAAIKTHMHGVGIRNLGHYLTRGKMHGLLTCEYGNGTWQNPSIFTVATDWKTKADNVGKKHPRPSRRNPNLAGRGLGKVSQEIFQYIQETGKVPVRTIKEKFPMIDRRSLSKRLLLGQDIGIVTQSRGDPENGTIRPVYEVVKDWRRIAERRITMAASIDRTPKRPVSCWSGVNSIFSAGG